MKRAQPELQLPSKIEHYIATLAKRYESKKKTLNASILVNAHVRVHEAWSYDNWNGGTYGHALFLTIPESIYLQVVDDKSSYEEQITKDINAINSIQNEFIEKVVFEMEIIEGKDWRKKTGLLIAKKRNVGPHEEKRLWAKGAYRVFLSHKSEVKKDTSVLKDELLKYGVSAFVAHKDIHPTEEWQIEIENALTTMDAFIALMTKDFHNSDWTDQEVGFAFARNVPMIAIRLGKDPYGFIGKFQGLSCSWDKAPIELVKILIKQQKMIDAYINSISTCKNFNHGNSLAEILPFIDSISAEQETLFVDAYNNNIEAKGSFGLNGTKPLYYGDGLAYHLNRLTGKKYKYSTSGNLILSKK